MTRNNRSGLESQALITCYVILSDERAVTDEEQLVYLQDKEDFGGAQ